MPPEPNGFKNPFRPGAGHMPPYLAGREVEQREFKRLLRQETILENLVLTGLRGVGKTVLLEALKPAAISEGWLWVGTDLSETSSISEINMATRILADLSVITSSITISVEETVTAGFGGPLEREEKTLSYQTLCKIFDGTPGLTSDKLKAVLELVWKYMKPIGKKGVIFAYDEAQTAADHAERDQHPLSLLLDVFQSIQRRNIPFMLILAGLPTLFPKLVEARTYAERMFRVIFLDRLDEQQSREAIEKPVEDGECPIKFSGESVSTVYRISGGYPYFIQFICKEVYDVWVQNINASIPVDSIVQKLDTDFFAGRWARATDRQRELLRVISFLENCEGEFTVQEIVAKSKDVLEKPFSSSHVNQMLVTLADAGLVYKNRHGKYSFAVPLLDRFIRRQPA